MVLRITTGLSTEDEDAEDDEENKNYKDSTTGKHKATIQRNFLGWRKISTMKTM